MKPTSLKLIQGTARPDRNNPNEPQPAKPARVPSPPGHLGKIAKAEWRRTASKLHDLGLLTLVDTEMLAQYCKAVEEERECCGRLARWNLQHPEHPNVMKTGTGSFKSHPWVLQRDVARKRILEFAREFGMSPAARPRVSGMISAPKASKFDQFK